jgi:hypothetical protein
MVAPIAPPTGNLPFPPFPVCEAFHIQDAAHACEGTTLSLGIDNRVGLLMVPRSKHDCPVVRTITVIQARGPSDH